MTQQDSSRAPKAIPAYRVRAPRPSDAVAGALRRVYARDGGIPEDMEGILRRLDDSAARC